MSNTMHRQRGEKKGLQRRMGLPEAPEKEEGVKGKRRSNCGTWEEEHNLTKLRGIGTEEMRVVRERRAEGSRRVRYTFETSGSKYRGTHFCTFRSVLINGVTAGCDGAVLVL